MKIKLLLLFFLSFNCFGYQEIVQKYVDDYTFQGNILIQVGGEVVFEKSYGFANIEHEVPNSVETKFLVGSLTKQYTAAAIMKLQEDGLLSVSDKIGKFFTVPPHWKHITVHQLLTHTAGLARKIPNNTAEFHTTIQLIKFFMKVPLEEATRPGKFYYSNGGYTILVHLVEILSGEFYGNYLSSNFFENLGFIETGVYHSSMILPNRASGYIRIVNRGELSTACCYDYYNAIGAGNNYSTARELIKWYRSIENYKVLSKESVDLMFTPHTYSKKNRFNYGYGWMTSRFMDHKIIWHNGSINGYNSELVSLPEKDIVIVILANIHLQNHFAGKDPEPIWFLGQLRNELLKKSLYNRNVL